MNATEPIKVIVIGETGSGKTSLCQRLMKLQPDEEQAPSTVLLENIEVDGVNYNIEVTDTPGSELYIPRMEAEVPGANGFILVFSLTSRETFIKGKRLLPHLWKYKSEKRFPIVIVGNKVDLKDERVLRFEDGNSLAASWYGVYHEISALIEKDVNEVFVAIVKEIMKPLEERKPRTETTPTKPKSCCWIV